MSNMDNLWNFSQSNLRSYKPRFLHRNLKKHVTRSKNDRFICNLYSPEKYKCQKCCFQSDLKVLSTKHVDTVHKTKATEHYPTPELKYCKKCGFQTHSALVLLSHDNSCDRGNSSLGHIKVKSVYDLSSTPLEHEEDERLLTFQCEHCFYRSMQKKCLKVHLRSMHPALDQRCWYRCKHCSYKTTHKGHLNRHLHGHDWLRQLEILNPANVEKSLGRKQEKILPQPNQKKMMHFECLHCFYTSTQKDCLKVHLRTVHPSLDQSYWLRCEYCSYKSKHKGHLKKHLSRQHTDTLEPKKLSYFKCEQCSYKHINILKVRSHMHRVHIY